MALVCSICLFCASRNISADLSYQVLSSSILHSHISKNCDCHTRAMPPSLTSHLFLFTLLRLFSSAFLFSPMTVAVEGVCSFELSIEIPVTSAAALEAPLSPLAKVALPSIGIFRRVNPIAITHHLVKKIEIWKPIFNRFYSNERVVLVA